jgi:hypothetical protein
MLLDWFYKRAYKINSLMDFYKKFEETHKIVHWHNFKTLYGTTPIIRGYDLDGKMVCPVIAVARLLEPEKSFDFTCPHEAAYDSGIVGWVCDIIISASDDMTSQPEVRRELLKRL